MKKLSLTLSLFALSGLVLFGADAAKTAAPAAKPAAPAAKPAEKAGKLVPVLTMEQAFAKSLQKREVLARILLAEEAKLAKADAKSKPEIEKTIANARKSLNDLTTYMDVIYGLGGRRTYEYNNVTSEIYLRVGTVTEVFTRALAARDSLAKQIAAAKAAIGKEKDAAKKTALENAQKSLEQRHALVANALFNIFQIHPARSYHFDTATQKLYVRVTDEEAAKLQEQAKKNAEAQKAKAAAQAQKAAAPAKK